MFAACAAGQGPNQAVRRRRKLLYPHSPHQRLHVTTAESRTRWTSPCCRRCSPRPTGDRIVGDVPFWPIATQAKPWNLRSLLEVLRTLTAGHPWRPPTRMTRSRHAGAGLSTTIPSGWCSKAPRIATRCAHPQIPERSSGNQYAKSNVVGAVQTDARYGWRAELRIGRRGRTV
jgi:hypothetical protein